MRFTSCSAESSRNSWKSALSIRVFFSSRTETIHSFGRRDRFSTLTTLAMFTRSSSSTVRLARLRQMYMNMSALTGVLRMVSNNMSSSSWSASTPERLERQLHGQFGQILLREEGLERFEHALKGLDIQGTVDRQRFKLGFGGFAGEERALFGQRGEHLAELGGIELFGQQRQNGGKLLGFLHDRGEAQFAEELPIAFHLRGRACGVFALVIGQLGFDQQCHFL